MIPTSIEVEPRTRDEIVKLAREHADKAFGYDPMCGETSAASAAVSFFNAINLKMNFCADPRLDRPHCKGVSARISS